MKQPTKYLRIDQIVRNRSKTNDPLLPISVSAWWDGVRAGIYPKPIKLGGVTLWIEDEVFALLESFKNNRAA